MSPKNNYKKLPTSQKKTHNYYVLESEVNTSSNKKQNIIVYQILSFIKKTIEFVYKFLKRKYQEKITLMFIPHNGKSLKNYHISNLVLSIILIIFIFSILISSIYIIKHNSSIQKVDKLKISKEDNKLQFNKVKEDIKVINTEFNKIKEKISKLYNIIHKKPVGSNFLYAEGGASLLNPTYIKQEKNHINQFPSNEKIDNELALEIYILNDIIDNIKISKKPLQEIQNFINTTKVQKILHHTPTLWPLHGYIVNPYGFIRNAKKLNVYFNNGIDIGASPGMKVVSTAPGIIKEVKNVKNNVIEIKIQHHYGYQTIYRGLNKITVKKKQSIKKGEVIGFLGLHPEYLNGLLHYKVLIGVESQNPMIYLNHNPKI